MQSSGSAPVARDARLWALALGNFTIGTGALIISGLLPLMATDLGRSHAAMGQAITAFALAVALGGPLLAGPTSRLDRRLALSIALAVFILGNILGALATSYEWLLASRVVAGLGAALFTPHASVAASLLAPPQIRGRAITLVFTGFTASTVLGVPLGTMAGDFAGWRAALWGIAGVATIALVGLRTLLPRDLRAPAIDARAWLRVTAAPNLSLLLVVTLMQSTGQFVLLSYIAPALKEALAASGTLLGALFVVYSVFGILGNLVGGKLIDSRGAASVVHLMLACVAVGLALFPLAGAGVAFAVLATAIWGFGSFACNGAQQPRLIAQAPDLASATLPLNSSAIYVGQALGAGLGGITIAQFGVTPLGPIGATMLVVALVVSLLAAARQRASG